MEGYGRKPGRDSVHGWKRGGKDGSELNEVNGTNTYLALRKEVGEGEHLMKGIRDGNTIAWPNRLLEEI